MLEFLFENYLVCFPADVSYKTYDDKYCYGIKFADNNDSYELIHNREVNWSRIYVTKNNVIKDIPFKESAFGVLPGFIILTSIEEQNARK
jgi:hypothetical protein